MKNFFEKNKIFLGIIIAGLMIAAAIYFGLNKPADKEKYLSLSSSPSPAQSLAPAEALVTKVIDGDTIIVEGGYNVRLLGIDADEAGYPCYEAAKKRLEELILNKTVRLEKDQTDVDQYKRYLRYIFLDDKNICLELVKEGLAIARFYEPDRKYKNEIVSGEKEAIEKKVGCKWSASTNVSADKLSYEKNEFSYEKLTTGKTGLKVVGAYQSGNYYGREVIVEGKVVGAYRSKTNIVFLNFDKTYPNQYFVGVIFSSDQYKFVEAPEKYYAGKTVRIKGKIKEYRGKPEIIIKDPSQIEIGK
ncbi:MAG: thermonuclease family protein [Elusimicrobiota bacterium]